MGRHLVLMGLRGAEQGCTVTASSQTLPLLFVWVPCLERKSLITFGSSLFRGSHQFTVASVGATLVCHWALKNSTATFRPLTFIICKCIFEIYKLRILLIDSRIGYNTTINSLVVKMAVNTILFTLTCNPEFTAHSIRDLVTNPC